MPQVIRTLGILTTVGLVGYAGVLLLGDAEVNQVVEDAVVDARTDEEAIEARDERRERLEMVARGMMTPDRSKNASMPEDDPAAAVPVPEVPYAGGELEIEGVRTSFDYAMDRVDAIANSRKRITKEDWDKLYREANDSFAALSIVLDAHDEAQSAELEAAHVRLKKGLKRVRIRGRKFGT
ncbi:MAG: hypothetical protein AAF799_01705 [Myxococcota bacterium]